MSRSERVLGVAYSEGLHDPGPVRWPLALCLLAAWIIIFLCILKGIRSSGKVSQHKVVIVRMRQSTHTHTPTGPIFAAVSCLMRLCRSVLSGCLRDGHLPVLGAHCFDHQRCYTGGLPPGHRLLPHTRLEPISQCTGTRDGRRAHEARRSVCRRFVENDILTPVSVGFTAGVE